MFHYAPVTPARIHLVLAAGWFGLGLALVHAAEPSRQHRVAALPEDDRVWLTELVAPIILPEEERVFLQLTEAPQREGFQSDFWQRREKPDLPLPMGPGYRGRYRELRRLVDEKYDGWQSDVGRLVLRRGEPDSIFTPRCGGEEVFRDLEVWTYGLLTLNGHSAASHIFYRPNPGAPRRLWIVHDGNASVFAPNPCRVSFDRLSRDCGQSQSREDRCSPCEDRCVVYQAWAEILKRQGSPAGALAEQAELFGYPRISTEGLNRKKPGWATAAQPSAKTREIPALSAILTNAPTPAPTKPAPRQPTPAPTPPATRQPTAAPPTPAPPTPVPATTTAPGPATRPPAPRPPAPVRTPTSTRPTAAPTPPPTPAPTSAPSPRPTTVPAPTKAPTSPPRPLSPSPTPKQPAEAAVKTPERLRKLSPEEIRERLTTLEPEYKEFLDLAKPFLTEEDVSRFLQLSGHDKDAFTREFWKRHS